MTSSTISVQSGLGLTNNIKPQDSCLGLNLEDLASDTNIRMCTQIPTAVAAAVATIFKIRSAHGTFVI